MADSRCNSPSHHERSRSRSPVQRSKVRTKKVVIANVPYDVSWQKIKELVREKIGYTGYIEMIEQNGKPMGMGVMEFKTYEGAEKAIEVMHRYPIGDRKLVVREETAKDRERIEQYKTGVDKMSAQQAAMNLITPQVLAQLGIDGPLCNQIYITNLDFSVTWQKLKDVFKLAGRVMNVELKLNRDKTPKGHAIVKFEHPFEAVQAISMFNNQVLFDRPMRIKMDQELTRAAGGGGLIQPLTRLPEGLKGVGMGLGMQGQAVRSLQDLAHLTSSMAVPPLSSGMGSGDGYGHIASLSSRDPLIGRGYGSASHGHHLHGLEMSNLSPIDQYMSDRYMHRGMEDLSASNHISYIGNGAANYSQGPHNSFLSSGAVSGYGLGGDMRSSSVNTAYPDIALGGGSRSFSDTVIVKNLPYSYTWQDLKRSFGDVGEVRFAEIKTDQSNRSIGVGIVRFYNPNDAARACHQMDNVRFDGRSIRVEIE